MVEQAFKISVADTDLDLLHAKLSLARFPDELESSGWEYGAPLSEIKRLVSRWKDGYDWRKHEAELNEMPQFTRDIEVEGFGVLNIHYVHKRSETEGAVPLCFVHGWPGSFVEARKIMPLLTAASPDHPSFHFVTFSLPGYGFSQPPSKKGFATTQYAEIGHKLMLALGYNEYVTQGGDLGYFVTRKMATLYGGKHVKAWHTNFTLSDPPSPLRNPLLTLTLLLHTVSPYSPYTELERKGLERSQWFGKKGRGYYEEQSTQPQTLGYGLADSPVGLLAWIYEKLVNWSDEYEWDDDEVLTWISIYWFSRPGPTASLRIYYENRITGDRSGQPTVTGIPMGVSYFPKELFIVPKSWMRTVGNVAFESDHTSGGHFAAYEKPEELVGDLRNMFGKSGSAFGVVAGKNGYKL